MFFLNDKTFAFFSHHENAELPTRDQIEEKYKWNLTDLYKSDDDWDSEFKWVKENIPAYKKFEGTLSKSSGNLLDCFNFDNEMGTKLERLYLYSMLAKDGDMKSTKYQAMDDRIKSLYTEVISANSFIKPELLQIPDEKLIEMINSKEQLKIYDHFISNLLREKPHTLNKEQELILASASEIASVPYNTYSIFTNADFVFPKAEDENGNTSDISHARFYAAMYSKDREYRKRVFKNYFVPYKNYINTITSLFNGNLKANIFNARVRKYKSAREAALNKNNIPISVYDNLVETACQNLKPLHRWANIKKRILKLDELHPYDIYVSVFSMEKEKKYSYEDSKNLVYESLKPMGDDYLNSLKTAFENRWIDVYETKAKRSGAYSSGTTFGVHPYVLLNWTDLLNDVFTLTHEMGHNMHSYYTGKNQPYIYANYTIFLAEVASTFNESLLLDYLIQNSSNEKEKLFLIEKYLNNITATFYRQIMFAEYEMWAYDQVENGIALTSDVLSEQYKKMYEKYWGHEMVVDEEEKYTWSRIPHFYYNFYVYQYATGFSASEVLSQKVKAEGKKAVEKYLNFLKAGSSDYSINILKNAGVDMNSPEPILATTRKMNELLDKVESILSSLK